jgi:hypothetical protein
MEYLKYWKVVKMWMRITHDLTEAELDLLLFLHGEKYFCRRDYEQYNDLFTWDKRRFDKLVKKGWIERMHRGGKYNKSMHCITDKTRLVFNRMYRVLSMKELIPETRHNNPAFKSDARFIDKMQQKNIVKMNEEIRELKRRRARESQEKNPDQA